MTPVETYSTECDRKTYQPSGHAQVFLDDMRQAICHTDQCQYQMNMCSHARLSTELLKAMLDTYAVFLEKHNQKEAAELLRSEI